MDNARIEQVIEALTFIRSKLYNGIYREVSTPALTDAIDLIRELQGLRAKETEDKK